MASVAQRNMANDLLKQENDLAFCFEAVVDVAKKAGEIIRAAFTQKKAVLTKSSFADLVTETDKHVEEVVIGFLRDKFPTHSFIGEESAVEGQHSVLSDNPTWIIDPVDGTTNFVHGYPYVAISIALLVNKTAQIGLVYNPITEEMYTAQLGGGAFCNGQRIQASAIEGLGEALICAEFGSSRDAAQLDAKFQSMRRVLEQAHGIRALGSAALNMCSVAAGRTDAYWEFGVHAWDIAAGDLIVREAGGVVISTDGGPLDVLQRRVLCAGTRTLALSISEKILQMTFESD